MTADCCAGRGPSRPLARRLFGVAASLLPGAALALLPKCPLCLAAWLAIVTGVGVSSAAAARLHGVIVAVGITGAALAAAQIVRALRLRPFGPRRRSFEVMSPATETRGARR